MSEALQRISVKEFLNSPQSHGKLLVIDVRTAAEVNTEYLGGCTNIPLHELTPASLQACITEKGAGQEEPVYLLCASGRRAESAVAQLKSGLPNPLLVIEGGLQAIKQTGMCLKKGTGSVIPLERQVRIAAGALVLLGVLLGTFVNPAFYGLSGFVGAGLIFAGITDTCGMALALARMPWNRVS